MKIVLYRGGYRFFSRGADFQKNFENFILSNDDQIDFASSPKAFKRPCFGHNFLESFFK